MVSTMPRVRRRGPSPASLFAVAERGHLDHVIFPPIHPVFLFYCGCAAASAAAPRPDIYLTSLKTFCVLLCYEHVLRDQEQSIPRNGYLNLPCQLNTAEVYHFNKNWGGSERKRKKENKKKTFVLWEAVPPS